MSQKKNIIFREFTSYREDGSIEVIINPKGKACNLVLNDDGDSIKLVYSTDLCEDDPDYDRVNAVKNVIRKANVIGRAAAALKNHLKRDLYPRLLELGEISQEEYNSQMKNLE